MSVAKLRPAIKIFNVSKSVNRNVAVNAASASKDDLQSLKPFKEIPGPPSLPIIGQLHNFLPGGLMYNSTGMELFDKLYKNYGPIIKFEGSLGRPGTVFLFDAESASQILRGENILPDRPGFDSITYYRKEYKKNKLGKAQRLTGLVSDMGENWKEFRTNVNPIMLQPKTIRLYENSIDEVAKDMVERLRSKRDRSDMITEKFDEEMNLWSLESIGVIALGGRLNCFDPNLPEDSLEKRLISCVHEIFDLANELDFKVSFWRYFPTRQYKRAMKIYEEQEEICKEFIKRAMKDFKNTDGEKPILQKLLEINEEIAIIMASDMLFAGVDTTSNTMTATLFLLAKNPEVQEKLREEIIAKNDRKYLKSCFRESLRILPVVIGNMREVKKEYNILGYRIPEGTRIVFTHQYMANMENYFPRPKEYIPERWLVGKDDPLYYRNAHPFAYNPFGFGVRSCIGRRIAELELETFLSKILENFRVEWIGPDLTVNATSLNYIAGPFGFKFSDLK